MNKHYKVEYVCSVPNEKDSVFSDDNFDTVDAAKNWIVREIDNMNKNEWWYGGKKVKSYKIIEITEDVVCSYDVN